MNVFAKAILSVGVFSIATGLIANTVVNQQAVQQSQVVNQQAFYASTTVKNALTLSDDSKVKLQGYIVKATGDEEYEFRDNTGSIIVEIDDKLWNGKAITAKTPITIKGEVDVDYKPIKHVKIDVDSISF